MPKYCPRIDLLSQRCYNRAVNEMDVNMFKKLNRFAVC